MALSLYTHQRSIHTCLHFQRLKYNIQHLYTFQYHILGTKASKQNKSLKGKNTSPIIKVKITLYSIFGINLRKLFLLFPWQQILKTNHYSIDFSGTVNTHYVEVLSDIIFQLESKSIKVIRANYHLTITMNEPYSNFELSKKWLISELVIVVLHQLCMFSAISWWEQVNFQLKWWCWWLIRVSDNMVQMYYCIS